MVHSPVTTHFCGEAALFSMTTLSPNDNNLAINCNAIFHMLPGPCRILDHQKTSQLTIADGMTKIRNPTHRSIEYWKHIEYLFPLVRKWIGDAQAAGDQDHPCDPHWSSATPGFCPPTAYELRPALVRITEENSRGRGEKECEGRRG